MSLSSIISTHISTLYGGIVFSPTLSAPPRAEHGEYCFGVFTLAKPLGKSPNMIAEEIAVVLRTDNTHFTQINTIGGYVNLSCTASVWMDILSQVENQKQEKKNETIVVDYIGANAGKPLHIGHICTPSVGQAICNIYRHLGYDVISDSHYGDWGGIFGKLIAAGKSENENNTESLIVKVKSVGVNYLLELYQKATKQLETEKSDGVSDFDVACREEFLKLSK